MSDELNALRQRIAELEQQLAALRAETWQPCEDGRIEAAQGNGVQVAQQGSCLVVWYSHNTGYNAILPDNLRLCKRGGDGIAPAEFTRLMDACASDEDVEVRHANADALMCEVLRQLGYGDGVRLFERMTKWYA